MPFVTEVDPRLKEWATPRQVEFIDLILEHKTIRNVAKHLGLNHTTIGRSISSLKTKAAKKGYSPDHDMVHTVPDPFVVKGVSTYYNKDGNPAGQWVKTTLDQQRVEAAIRAAVEAISEDVVRAKPVPMSKAGIPELCNLYVATDCHIGMRAWKPETDGDWDLSIAERLLVAAFTHLIKNSPKAKTGIVCQLGDFLHFDSLMPITPQHGHVLDADGRYSKVVKTATKILRTIIDTALQHHEQVIVDIEEGNHDMASSVWLRHLFSLLYENEPRVNIVTHELPFYCYTHGKVLIAFHHGHMVKNPELPGLFAAQFAKSWGATTKRYVHVGHRHHVDEKEYNGMTVIQHPTLAARDAYAARGGWVAEGQASSITYHEEWGQVARNTVVPEMLGEF